MLMNHEGDSGVTKFLSEEQLQLLFGHREQNFKHKINA